MKGTTTGKADVYLDGAFKTTVDLSAAAATYQVDVWNTGLLANGLHHVTIQWNTGNAAGKYVTLDRVDVLGTIAYAPPAITSLSPSLGATAGGTTVAINGSGFTEVSGLSAVTFGGVNATSYTVNSPSKITAVAPAHAAGAVQVQVTAAGGATFDTAADDFTYVVAPTMTRLDVTAANLCALGVETDRRGRHLLEPLDAGLHGFGSRMREIDPEQVHVPLVEALDHVRVERRRAERAEDLDLHRSVSPFAVARAV